MARKYRVPVVVVVMVVVAEVSMEKVSHFGMIDKINEFEELDCRRPEGRQGIKMAGLLE